MNKDNQIMSLLSEIDEELIDDILEKPISPEETSNPIKADKKGILAKFALPIAACLTVAAVSVGVLIVSGKNIVNPIEGSTSGITSTVDNTSDTSLSGVSPEDVKKCEEYIQNSNLSYYVKEGCTFSDYVIDLDFDGKDEIIFFPSYDIGTAFFFKKTGDSYGYAGMWDMENTPYPLNDFNDIYLYDKNGEKYYYYYYFNEPHAYYEGKGIAKLQLDENGITTESLLSYGAYLSEHPNDELINLLTHFYKIGESNASYDELSALWSEYEGVPPIEIEDYWYNGTVSLENAPLLSDLIKENALPNIDGSYVQGKWENNKFNFEGTASKVILCQKDCGENKISLLGYKVRTDNAYDSGRVIAHRLMLVLSDKNGNLLSLQKVIVPNNLVYGDCDFPIAYIDDSLEVADFGENQVILYRCISEDNLFQSSKPFGVKKNQILPCLYSGTDYEDPEHYVPSLSALYTVDKDSFSITDEITNESLCFDFSGRYNLVEYVGNLRETDDTFDIGEYLPVSAIDIPIINAEGLNYKEQARYILENAVPKVLFAQKTLTYGGSTYTLCVIADKVWSYPTDFLGNKTSCASKRTAVFKDGEYLGSAFNRQVMNRNFYSDYMPEVCYFAENDALVIVSVNPGISGLGISGEHSFAAVKDGVLYPDLIGSNDDTRNKPDWAKGLYGNETPGNIDVETNGSTLTCGYFVYRFNFDDENFGKGESDFNVSWRETSPDA